MAASCTSNESVITLSLLATCVPSAAITAGERPQIAPTAAG
jgi:hypothetical protein